MVKSPAATELPFRGAKQLPGLTLPVTGHTNRFQRPISTPVSLEKLKKVAEKVAEHVEKRASGAPLANSNAIRHGLYSAKSRDLIKAQRLRRRVARRLRDVPSELRPIMRPALAALVEVEDRLATMKNDLDERGLTNGQGEPRRLVSEYRHYMGLWLKLAEASGLTLASFTSTRRDALHGDALALQRWAEGDES